MPGKKIKFSRTETAAKSERITKWDLIAAIAEDADEAGIPISGIESQLAAKTAFDAAGNEHADSTVKALCVTAKYDFESTSTQRKIWRRYGWTSVRLLADAGWSQSAAAQLLGAAQHRTYRDVAAAVATTRRPSAGPKGNIDERWSQWVQRAAKVMMDGAALMAESEGAQLGSHSEMAAMIYQSMSDRQLDAEIRRLLDSEGVR